MKSFCRTGSAQASRAVAEIFEGTAEVPGVREYRERRGASLLVGSRDLGRRDAGANLAGARRAALELGDHGQPGPHQGFAEGPLLGPLGQPPLELLQRDLGASLLRACSARTRPALRSCPSRPLDLSSRRTARGIGRPNGRGRPPAAPESIASVALVDSAGEVARAARHVDRRARIENRHVAGRARRSLEHGSAGGRVLRRLPAEDRIEGGGLAARGRRPRRTTPRFVRRRPRSPGSAMAMLSSSMPSSAETTSALRQPSWRRASAMISW